jgi:DNA-binding MarR family transcriptional regulator
MTGPHTTLPRLTDRLARFFFLTRQYGLALHAADGISTGERAILREIAEAGSRSVPELAAGRAISRQAVQKTVDALVRRGAISKASDPEDRRSRRLVLAPEGNALLRRMARREAAEATAVSGAFTREELAAFESVLERMESLVAERTFFLGSRNE